MTDLEKMAEGIFGEMTRPKWEGYGGWPKYIESSKAALRSIRTPSDAVLEAMVITFTHYEPKSDYDQMREIFAKAIDAILEEDEM